MNPDDDGRVVITIGKHEFPVAPGHSLAPYPCTHCGCLMDEARDVECIPKQPATGQKDAENPGATTAH